LLLRTFNIFFSIHIANDVNTFEMKTNSCPYCDVRNTHAGHSHVTTTFDSKAEKKFEMGKTVKNRQEPCHVIQIAEIVAKCHNVSLQKVADTCYENSLQLFFSDI
jgi:TatD DNase family protein